MDTNKIKKFATEARNKLKDGIRGRISQLGFDAKGNVSEDKMPQLMQGGTLWNRGLETESFYYQWMSLYNRVQTKGLTEVYEEAAYTWFNRLMAIRILQKNGLCEPVMEYADAARTPRIVNEARMGNIPQMPEEVRRRLMDLLDDDTKVTEQFAVLVTAWCHQNPIIQNCFGSIKDYTELLLPTNILAEGGFVDMINHTEFISDEDYSSAELIGWLYQFYISERKAEVMARDDKYSPDEIPAATQIFTPNWIVKYMVQNTIGRIYLDNNPYAEDEFKPKWKYLVDPSEPTPEEAIYHYDELTDLKVADLACGSGHILNECFDLLYELYTSEAYSRSEAIENIFKYNLTGVDLDNRAKQMAQFALLIKACQKDNRFADAHCMPIVLTMPEKRKEEAATSLSDILHQATLGEATPQMIEEIKACYDLMQDADSLGSIMKFQIGESTRLMIKQTVEHWGNQSIIPDAIEAEIPRFKLILALTEKYSALVMNPPYMGGGNMNEVLSKYVKKHYEEGKADLYTTFMLLAIDKLEAKGKYGMINMQGWMFLYSFEKLRNIVLKGSWIENMIHLGPKTFDELGGEIVQNTAFVICKIIPTSTSIFFRVVNGQNCKEKEDIFISINRNKENKNLFYAKHNYFDYIDGHPITAYHASQQLLQAFTRGILLGKESEPRVGMATANNDRFIRLWFEVSFQNACLFSKNRQEAIFSNKKWFPFSKGGTKRYWYGNHDYLVNWENDGIEIRNFKDPKTGRIRSHNYNLDYIFQSAITWGTIASGTPSFRLCPEGFLYSNSGYGMFFRKKEIVNYTLGLLNSKVSLKIVDLLSPGVGLESGYLRKIPLIINNKEIIDSIVTENISLSQKDWDSHETSWDFKSPEFLSVDSDTYLDNINYQIEEHYRKTGEHICIDPAAPQFDNLEWCYNQYCQKWERLFRQLHANEEELNRQFIEIYGLQDELTPEVPLNEITILQQGEITITDNNEIKFKGNVLMKQLISYAVGIWMGRYRLDKPGLHIAHPEPTAEEIAPYTYKDETVYIDDDGIIPILPSGCPFDDNLASRVSDFIRIAFGEERLTENLNFMEKELGITIEQYLLKDFWKDHKKMYQNRPIYWLFSSKKGAFKCITYMHRMTPYTAERVRAKYLLPYIEMLNQKVSEYTSRAAALSTAERRQMDNWKKILEECNEYHDRLQVLAEDTERTAFDLDDGVVVNYAKYGDVLAKLK